MVGTQGPGGAGERGQAETEGCTTLGKGTLALELGEPGSRCPARARWSTRAPAPQGTARRVVLAWLSRSLCFWAC